jgi:hypothetical protein
VEKFKRTPVSPFPSIFFADPHSLNLVVSIFRKSLEGGGGAIYAGNGPPTGPPTVVFGGSGGEYGPDGMFGAIIGCSRR